jgi:Ca2+-binding EF-hand superfamily protein
VIKRHLCLAALPLLLTSSAVFAQGGQPQPRVVLLALDTDGDGQLSAAEIAASSRSLARLDANHDGQLTSDEYSPKLEDKTATSDLLGRLMLFDKNGDGVLTADEVPERMKPMFDRGDTNHDGKLTKDEIEAMSSKQADPQGRPIGRGNAAGMLRMDPIMNAIDTDHDGVFSVAEIAAAPTALITLDKDGDGALSAQELRPRQQTPAERAQHLFDEWDTNQDGALLKEELPDRMQESFDKIDTNHDGKIDMAEATAYMASQPQGRGGPGGSPGGQGGRPRPENATPQQ